MIGSDRFARLMTGSRMLVGDGCRRSGLVKAMILECRYCAFEPEDQLSTPVRCPKCHGCSWNRYPRPGQILMSVDRN